MYKRQGCTVHLVDNQYDHGPIVAQRVVDVLPEDTSQALAARVFAQECVLYPEVVNHFANDEVSIQGRQVIIGNPAR